MKKKEILQKTILEKDGISHSLLNFAEYDGKEESNTVDYTTAYLFSDWFYLLWLGIKYHISQYYFSKWPPGDLFKSLTKKN